MPIKQPILKPVHFRSVNIVSPPSANIRWATADSVNFMDHLYFLTDTVLDYLLDDTLPKELMNQTLLDDPVSVVVDHRNELITHFHKLLIAACACLCIGISIPLFGFMIACCWCSGSSKSSSKRVPGSTGQRSNRSTSRSRSHHRGEPSDADWLALTSRESTQLDPTVRGSRHSRDDRRRRHGRGQHRRSHGISSSSAPYRSRSMPPSLKFESSCHPCLRGFFSSNLFINLLLVAFFTVCAFVTNEYVDNGVKQLPRALNHGMDEIHSYLNNTDYEVDNLLVVNYNQLQNEINTRLDTSGAIMKHKLAISSEAIALFNLSDIVTEIGDTKTRLEKLDSELSNLKSYVGRAKKFLNDIRMKIEKCPPSECSQLRRRYNNLDNFKIISQFEKLPDVKHLVKSVASLIETKIVGQVQSGKDKFDHFGENIQAKVNESSHHVKSQLSTFGGRLATISKQTRASLSHMNEYFNKTRTNVKELDRYIEYEIYRRYACLGGSAVILFILLCYTLGWLFGSCRPQPTARTYKTNVKTSASASFPFSCGIFIVFLLFLPLILAAIVLFMTGSVGDKIVCQVIKHPEQKQSKQIYAMLQNKFLSSDLRINSIEDDKVTTKQVKGKEYKIYQPNFADFVARCHQNQSIYRVIKLDQYDRVIVKSGLIEIESPFNDINLDKSFSPNSTNEFKQVEAIEKRMKEFIKQINFEPNIVLLSDKAEEILKKFTGLLLFDDVEKSFTRLYDSGITLSPIDVEQLIKDIHAQKATITDDGDLDGELTIALTLATSFTEKIMPNITNSILNLREGIRHLKTRIFHGKGSFESVINDSIDKVRNAEKILRSSGRLLLERAASEFFDELNGLLNQYAHHAKHQVENVIGQCEPLSRALNSTTSTLCDDIVLPFNGFWLSSISALILLLPATLLAYGLRALYRLARRSGGSHMHHSHNYTYTDQEDEISYEDDSDEIAFTYHVGRPNHLSSNNKPSSSAAIPSAPLAREDGWSPSSQGYLHNSRPPPYAV